MNTFFKKKNSHGTSLFLDKKWPYEFISLKLRRPLGTYTVSVAAMLESNLERVVASKKEKKSPKVHKLIDNLSHKTKHYIQ